MILITGAAGKTGRAVLAALAHRHIPVRCFIRRRDHEADLRAAGASDVSVGSMTSEADLSAALRDCSAVYHIAPNVDPSEVKFETTLIAAIHASGSQARIVYHSVLHPQIEAMPHHWAKMRVEEHLLASGLLFSILRPSAYMQNILAAVPTARNEGRFVTPYPTATRLSLIDVLDLGEAAAKVLTEPGHDYAAYDLCGTPPLDQHAVARALSQVIGRDVAAEELPVVTWARAAQDLGLSAHARDTLARMFRTYAAQGLPGNPGTLRSLLGREPTSLDAMLRRSLA
jgi:NAD(P)H dehydrogenase (quinone)